MVLWFLLASLPKQSLFTAVNKRGKIKMECVKSHSIFILSRFMKLHFVRRLLTKSGNYFWLKLKINQLFHIKKQFIYLSNVK